MLNWLLWSDRYFAFLFSFWPCCVSFYHLSGRVRDGRPSSFKNFSFWLSERQLHTWRGRESLKYIPSLSLSCIILSCKRTVFVKGFWVKRRPTPEHHHYHHHHQVSTQNLNCALLLTWLTHRLSHLSTIPQSFQHWNLLPSYLLLLPSSFSLSLSLRKSMRCGPWSSLGWHSATPFNRRSKCTHTWTVFYVSLLGLRRSTSLLLCILIPT